MSDAEGDPSTRLSSMLETVSGMREIVQGQTRQVDKCLHLLKMHRDGELTLPDGDDVVFGVILTMIHMVGISGHSLLKLTDEISLGVKDAYPIARSIVEGAINTSYIMAAGPEAAKKAARHAEVKSYRDLNREWRSGAIEVSVGVLGELPQSELERLEAMLPEFTTKRGGERNWTDASLNQRLDAISEAFSSNAMISLNASAFNIYRHASEVVHASYFSARFFGGLTLPGRPAPSRAEDLKLTLADHQFSVLMSAIFAYAGLIECFSAYVRRPELITEVNVLLGQLANLPAVAEALGE